MHAENNGCFVSIPLPIGPLIVIFKSSFSSKKMAPPGCWSIKQSENGSDHRQLSARRAEMCSTNSSLHTRGGMQKSRCACAAAQVQQAVASAAARGRREIDPFSARAFRFDAALYNSMAPAERLATTELHFLSQ